MSIEKLDLAREFCRNNLAECCKELLDWSSTGMLVEGKVRDLCSMVDFVGYAAMQLAETIVKHIAMEWIVENLEDQ